MTETRTKVRMGFVLAGMVIAFAGLVTNAALLHLGDHDQLRQTALKNCEVERKVLGGRGNICDAGGPQNVLALNAVAHDVCVDPSIAARSNRASEVAALLAERFNLPADELAVKLKNASNHFAYVQRFVSEENAEPIRKLALPGVFLQEQPVRHYPQHMFMCHVLGFVNYEGAGSGGVEQRADQYLRGCPGLVQSRVNALRQPLYSADGFQIPAIQGADVTLTLDQNAQFIVEQALDRAMEDHNAKGAWIVVQRVRTGEILAMASRPAFDPNHFKTVSPDARLNRAIGYLYEPGSTFKVIAFAAALDQGLVKPGTVLDCENGAWSHAGKILKDYHPYGRLTVADGLKKSSNILTAKLAVMLGDKRLYQYLQAFRLGQRTQIDLPGEEEGILHPVARWSGISSSRIAIGQGVAVTALQMAGVYCGIANDGKMMKPHVIREIKGQDGTVFYRAKPEEIGRCLSSETAALMRALLTRVTEEGGTGTRARVEGYEVAGKTGTAQKPVAGGYSSTDYVATFVGFLPAGDPEIGIVVVVDTPQPVHLGGVVAGPVFGNVAEQLVRCLDIPPSRTAAVALR